MSEIKPIVSIYIVNHNYGRFLKQSIESVLNQTYDNIELLIIDNESTDNSRNILLNYIDSPNVRILFHKNIGLNRTNNVAIKNTNGKYIMRLDADDYLDKNAVEIMINVFKRNSKVGLVFPDYYLVDKEGEALSLFRRHDFSEVGLLNQPAHGACTMIKRYCLEALDGYDESYHCQDGWDLWVRFINNFGVASVNLPLFFYRQHGKNLTSNEDDLFKTRSQIMQKASNQKQPKKGIAIIPIRGNIVDSNSFALDDVGGKALIDWTIESAIKSEYISHIVITSPDEHIKEYVNKKYNENIYFVQRSWKLALFDDSLDETLTDLFNQLPNQARVFDVVSILLIEYPFRKSYSIDMAFDALNVFETDVVTSVRKSNSNLYKHDGSGLSLISNSKFIHEEGNEIYNAAGGIIVMRRGVRYEDIEYEKNIGHIEIDEIGAFFINSNISLKLAKLYASERRV